MAKKTVNQEMKIKTRKISDLIRAEYNPRELTKEQQNQLTDSLKRFGLVDPIIVNTHKDRKNILVGGHQRMKVWESMGNETIPTVEVNLNLEKEKELNVRLNKNTGQFDMELIQEHFETDDLIEWGFDAEELEFFEPEVLEAEEDDYSVPDEIKTDIVLGDLIEIGKHRLLCGDSTCSDTVAKLMNGEKADMVFTDPPYNVNYEGSNGLKIDNDDKSNEEFYQFLYDSFLNFEINLKNGGGIYICHADLEGLNFRKAFNDVGFKLRSTIIWNKNALVMGRSDYHWKHEPILYGWKEGAAHKWNGDRKQTTVWECDKPRKNGEHPTMKPIELVSISINNSSYNSDTVLDLFLGSGSTMVAAHQLKRKCYGMELDPKYCQVIVDRMMKLDESLTVKINGKPYKK